MDVAVNLMLTESARIPLHPPRFKAFVTSIHLFKGPSVQIVILGLLDRDLGLPRQTRHVRKSHRPAARAEATHEAFSRAPMDGLRANVACLAFRVRHTRLDGLRDRLFVFFVCIILFRVTAAVYLLADLLVAAAPVVMLASGVAVARFADYTPFAAVRAPLLPSMLRALRDGLG